MDKPVAVLEKSVEESWNLEEALELRQKHILPSTVSYYSKPLMVVKGKGPYVFDEKGKKYIDGFAGVVTISIGHCHPHWVRAIQKQAAELYHTTTL